MSLPVALLWPAVLGYLIGSIPHSYLLGRWLAGVDLRRVGDGNVGARNLARQAGLAAGAAATLLDGLKGYGSLTLAAALALPAGHLPLVGLMAVLGHDFPLFLRGVGGQGMATTLGVLFYFAPLETFLALALYLLLWLPSRNFDRSMAVGLATLPIWLWYRGRGFLAGYSALMLVLIGAKKLLDLPRTREIRARMQRPH